MRWRAALCRVVLVWSVLCAAPVAAQTTVTGALNVAEMRGLAVQALLNGYPQQALAVADALIARDPDDYMAHIVRARAARDLGRFDAARSDAARAWVLAEDDGQKYSAAMTRAQVNASDGRGLVGQYWLRRAMDIAPDEVSKSAAVRDFNYVRARSPLSVRLRFGLAPNSNINNGSSSGTTLVDLGWLGVLEATLSGAALPLSGVEVSGGGDLTYRLHQSATSQTSATLSLDYQSYVLSSDAKRTAPGVKGRDFAYGTAQALLSHRGQLGRATRPFQIYGGLGQSWYGGDPFMKFAMLGARQSVVVSDGKARLDMDVSRRWQEAVSLRTSDADIWDYGLGYSRMVGKGNRLRFGLNQRQSRSISAAQDFDRVTLSGDLALGTPVHGARFEMGLSVGLKEHDRSPVAGQDRTDREYSASVTAVMDGFERFGFVPTISLTHRRTESDFGQYDMNATGLKLGLRSKF